MQLVGLVWIGGWPCSHTLDARRGRRMTGSALQSDGRCGGINCVNGRGSKGRVVTKSQLMEGCRIFKVVLPPRREAQNQEISFSDFSWFRDRFGYRSGGAF